MLHRQNLEFELTYANRAMPIEKTTDLPQTELFKLQLSNLLQTSLDVHELIRLFQTWVEVNISRCAMEYHNEHEELLICLAEPELHSYTYNLILDGQELGHIKFSRQNRFLQAEVNMLEEYLSLLLYPLKNALQYHQLFRSSRLDQLTGVGNRKSYEEIIKKELELSKRQTNSLVLIALDLDFFKGINDQFGHGCGDAYLKSVAQVINKTIRGSDCVFRIGGEEFTIILRGESLTGATILAERLRNNIAGLVCDYKGQAIQATASLGIALCQPTDDEKTFLERADEALYRAKKQGRNQVVIHSQGNSVQAAA